MAQIFVVHPENPQSRLLQQAGDLLAKGGLVAVPTDSSYAVVARLDDKDAAERLRTDPDAGIAQLAAELGYADHAHFATEFKRALGVAPSAYRADVSGDAQAGADAAREAGGAGAPPPAAAGA